MIRYRILIDGRLTSPLANSLEGVELEQGEHGTTLVIDALDAAEFDALLQRLGDLGVNVISLGQQPPRT